MRNTQDKMMVNVKDIFLLHKIGIVSIPLVVYYVYKRVFTGKIEKRGRAMSEGSRVMISGSFPQKANVLAPIVNILLWLDSMPEKSKLEANMKRLTRAFSRFRSSTMQEAGAWGFVELDDVNMSDHITYVSIDNEADLQAFVDTVVHEDMNGYGTMPLWNLMVISIKGTNKVAAIARFHHVLGDGFSMVQIMTEIFQESDGKPFSFELPDKIPERGGPKLSFAMAAMKAIASLVQVLALPASAYDSNLWLASGSRKTLKMNPDMHRTIQLPALRLDFAKALKSAAGVTINDLLMSLTAGMYRRYYEYRMAGLKNAAGVHDSKLCNRMLMPVAFPRPTSNGQMHNKWAFASIKIGTNVPTSTRDAASERLKECNRQTRLMKSSPTVLVQLWFQNTVVPYLPDFLFRQTAYDMFTRHTMVFSNVPGPENALYFAGSKLLSLVPIFPNLIDQGLVLSYDGTLFYNVNIDTQTFPESDKLPGMFKAELTALAKEYGLDTSDEAMLAPMNSRTGLALGCSNK